MAHASQPPGIYTHEDDEMIIDLDIASLYPSLADKLGIYPKHLGEMFLTFYRWMINTRLTEKEKKALGNFVIIEGFKLALNGAYGKMGEESSFLYDKLAQYKITIAGQIFISMWLERICLQLGNVMILQINTKPPLVF